jgi:pre-mRNA-splicing factor 18
MSIGNAPWPMGVSMAGIHERSGRDKLEEKHSAHILNDEVQRKFIISIKRLMTYAQHKYPAASNAQNCG